MPPDAGMPVDGGGSDAAPQNDLGPCPGKSDFYGRCVDYLKLFGQQAVTEASRDTVTGHGIYHAPGVIVDRSAKPNRIYVADSGNNRVLAFRFLGHCRGDLSRECTNDTDCPAGCEVEPLRDADRIIGQPDSTHAACNGDANVGLFGAPSARSLCLTEFPRGTNLAEQWGKTGFDVDSQGSLYVPDFYNNRVLIYKQPLGPLNRNGGGDSVADFVIGQDDFSSNQINRGMGAAGRDASSLWSDKGGTTQRGSVSVDETGAVWVADTGNRRVLRFPAGKNMADLVLGQKDMTAFDQADCEPAGPIGLGLDKLCHPTFGKIDPSSGALYVIDESGAGTFPARILVFKPPFTNGMAASKSIVAKDPGLPAGYSFQATGFAFNTYKKGAYAAGVLWVNEHSYQRTLLLDGDGNIVKIIGSRGPGLAGGDTQYGGYPGCGDIYTGYRLFVPSGVLGMDDGDNIYIADEIFHRVTRYHLPYDLVPSGMGSCLPDPNGGFLNQFGPNGVSGAKFSENMGAIAWKGQLIVRDLGRLMAWNDFQKRDIGATADVIVGQPTPDARPGNPLGISPASFFAIDERDRLWTANEQGRLLVFNLPLSSGQMPVANNVVLRWADDNTDIDYWTLAPVFDPTAKRMWLVDNYHERVLRIAEHADPTAPLRVDLVIGQPDKMETRCNQGLPAPSEKTVCGAYSARFDRKGNLYIVENSYECHGNDRVTAYLAADIAAARSLFPKLSAKRVWNRWLTQDFTRPAECGNPNSNDRPFSPVSIAFDSRNRMVIANDGYYYDIKQRLWKQLYLYNDPLAKQTPDASIRLPMGAPGDLAFDDADHLVAQDHTWPRVWVIDLDEKDGMGKAVWLDEIK